MELTLEQEKIDILAKKIASIYKKYSKKKYVDGIYINFYRDEIMRVNTAMITIICDEYEKYENLIADCRNYNNNQSYNVQYKTGILLKLRADYTAKYTKYPMNPSEYDRNADLINGEILLDRTNLFTEIHNESRFGNEVYSYSLMVRNSHKLEITPKINMKSGNN